jgi:tetratricopeptide (TPR) repeat protein
MYRACLVFFIGMALALAVFPAPGAAQPQAIAKLDRQYGRYYANREFEKALKVARQALALCNRTYGANHSETATWLDNVALTLAGLGQWNEAEELNKRGLSVWESVRGPYHPDVATSLNDLALLYKNTGRDAEAESLFRRAISIEEKNLTAEQSEMTALRNLIIMYESRGRYQDAEKLYQQNIAVHEKVFGQTMNQCGQAGMRLPHSMRTRADMRRPNHTSGGYSR